MRYEVIRPHFLFPRLCWHRSHVLHLPCYRRQVFGLLCRKHGLSCGGY